MEEMLKKKYLNFFIFVCLFSFSNQTYSINIDDNRIDPFKDIEDYEGVVYVKVGNSICTGALINHRTILFFLFRYC